jgi:hypothetical protein
MINLPDSEIERYKVEINEMSHLEMARRYRFSSSGDLMFRSDLPLNKLFMDRFKQLGGWTPEISKRVGWDRLDG